MSMRCKGVLAACAALAVALGGAWLWRRYGPATYARFDTMFGTACVYQVADDEGEPVRLLEVGGIVQSGTYLDERYTELVFEYLKRYDLMFEARPHIERVAVLGCGGYDYPEHLVAHYPRVTVDAVEIDPAITAIARQFFFLDRLVEEYETDRTGRLNLVCDDALAFLESSAVRYDAIVNDTFDAGTPPAHLTTRAFMEAVHERLRPDGLYLTNVVSALVGPDSAFLHQQVGELREVFAHVGVYPCATDEFAENDNVIVIATDGHLPAGFYEVP